MTAPFFVRLYRAEERDALVSFERFQQAIDSWQGMYFEPDGSFVWVGLAGGPAWQLDGMVYDRQGAIEYIELKGAAPQSQLIDLCRALVCNDSACEEPLEGALKVHRVDRGRWLTLQEFLGELRA